MRINGKEWQTLSSQEIADSQQNYANSFSQDQSYLEFIIFGKRPVKHLLAVEGARGLKIKMGLLLNQETGTQQLFPILCAVDKHGFELPAPEEVEFDEDDDNEDKGIQIMEDPSKPPVKCPTSCS